MIYYFGDSHTKGIGSAGSPKPEIWYHIPYSTYLTELLGIGSKNLAISGNNFVINVLSLIQNLGEIEKNASIVLFQTQFFCNSVLKYDNTDFYTKDIVVTSGLLNSSEIYENEILNITKDDAVTLLNWSSKFEERRSLYELDIVIGIFQYLKTKNIKCYLLYWSEPFDVTLPDNEFVLKFNNSMYPKSLGKSTSFDELTKGEWKDYHTTNDWNAKIANHIYTQIKNN